MFTLAHLSDPHLGPLPGVSLRELASKRLLGFVNWYLRRRVCHRVETFEALVADMKEAEPDHVAVTGDLVNIALGHEFARGRARLEHLGPPDRVTFVPGNHDIYVRATAGQAELAWGAFMRGDEPAPDRGSAPDARVEATEFPFVRRRGAATLIGLNSALPTGLLRASGTLGEGQTARLAVLLQRFVDTFRVVLIHHPPLGWRPRHKRLTDAKALVAVLARHGAELVLHGHDHRRSLEWIEAGTARIPVVGVPSGSSPGVSHKDDPAAYNLYRIEGSAGSWRCEMISRGLGAGRAGAAGGRGFVELERRMLL